MLTRFSTFAQEVRKNYKNRGSDALADLCERKAQVLGLVPGNEETSALLRDLNHIDAVLRGEVEATIEVLKKAVLLDNPEKGNTLTHALLDINAYTTQQVQQTIVESSNAVEQCKLKVLESYLSDQSPSKRM